MKPLRIHIEGVGIWSKQLANFAALQSLLAGQVPEPPPAKPAAATLPPNERRRAPESVLLAAEVAGQAVAMSGRAASSLTCVFSSSHGDQAITDYMCTTLAHAPNELSPIRFHNSVHNAPAGYWTIVTGCHGPSTAVCAHRLSFGAGLLEAISHALADNCAVLLVCSDIAGVYPLVEETGCTQSFGCALVLAPEASDATFASLDVALAPLSDVDRLVADPLPELLAGWRDANASAEALPLLALLAQGAGTCRLAAANRLALQIAVQTPALFAAATPLPQAKLASPESADEEHVA
jgi:hypothetical protein